MQSSCWSTSCQIAETSSRQRRRTSRCAYAASMHCSRAKSTPSRSRSGTRTGFDALSRTKNYRRKRLPSSRRSVWRKTVRFTKRNSKLLRRTKKLIKSRKACRWGNKVILACNMVWSRSSTSAKWILRRQRSRSRNFKSSYDTICNDVT